MRPRSTMPRCSSGSSMGLSESMTCCSVSAILLPLVLVQPLLDDVPGECCALDAHGELAHAGQRFQITQIKRRIRILALHERLHRFNNLPALIERLEIGR